MKHFTLSHCGGDKVVSAANRKQISDAIAAVNIKAGPGGATKIRNQLISLLKAAGWSGEVRLSADSDMTITSSKDDIGLCLQTGNMSRMYADLIKLQTMYLNNTIKAAAIILPSQEAAKLLGSNIAQAKRLERELTIFKKAYHVPTIVYALED
jgi:Restriction endonuclease BamHI